MTTFTQREFPPREINEDEELRKAGEEDGGEEDGGMGTVEDEAERRELLDRQVNLEEWVMSRAPVMEDPMPRQLCRARRNIFRIKQAWLRGVDDEVNGLLF